MKTEQTIDVSLRDKILSHPDVILNDADVMQALIAANDAALGDNVVDLRGIAMSRLETRLDRLEDTHRSVIAAAYDNLHGTQQIHRAVLRLMEARSLPGLLALLRGEVAGILRVDAMHLLLEQGPLIDKHAGLAADQTVVATPQGFIEEYLNGTHRHVVLREITEAALLRDRGDMSGSEACLTLHASGKAPMGLIVMASKDPKMFGPQQATDLLEFFAGVFERQLSRWLT